MKRDALVVLSLLLLAVETCAAAPARNLVAIVTDDQAAWTPGCCGGREICTPNLDRPAAEGVRFGNAFVHTPVCSPSRGMDMTSLFGTLLGFTDWLNDGQSKSQGVTPATPTWPSVLAKHGYTTCLIGKWHLGMREESLPWHNGLSEFTGNPGGGWTPNNPNNQLEEETRCA